MENIINSADNNSGARISRLAWFYRPIFGRQLLIYFCSSLLFAILTLLPFPQYIQLGLFSMSWTAMGIMVQLAPVVLAKSGDSRVIERLLPASAFEKLTLFLGYFFIVIPLAVYLLPELSLFIYKAIPAVHTEKMDLMVDLRQSNPPVIILMNVVNVLAVIITCLYVVLRAKRNRVLWGILSVFICNIILGALGAIYGLATLFRSGFYSRVENAAVDPNEMAKEVLVILSDNIPITVLLILLAAAYLVVMITLTYRQLKRSNL